MYRDSMLYTVPVVSLMPYISCTGMLICYYVQRQYVVYSTCGLTHAVYLMNRDVDAHEVGERLLGHGGPTSHGEMTSIQAQRLSHLLEEHDIGYRPTKWGS